MCRKNEILKKKFSFLCNCLKTNNKKNDEKVMQIVWKLYCSDYCTVMLKSELYPPPMANYIKGNNENWKLI